MFDTTGLNRRTFLQKTAFLVAGASVLSKSNDAHSETSNSIIYSSNFIPDKTSGKVAFVCDHHYWPDHLENWGGGTQITRNTRERMRDLIETLNTENPDISIHGGDVISAGGAFFPTPAEYAKQLAFEKRFFSELPHPVMPLIGNHETLDGRFDSDSQLQQWMQHFGPAYRSYDLKDWRLFGLNPLLSNYGNTHGNGNVFGNIFGIDSNQMQWLKKELIQASAQHLKVLLFAHVPPMEFENASEFENVISSAGCVKGMFCGHWHKNYISMLGGIPIMVRIANAAAPLGYTLIYLYDDGRIIVVQKSQHFPFEDFISSRIEGEQSTQGLESDRYFTLGGSSQMTLRGLQMTSNEVRAHIGDGHLTVTAPRGAGIVLIDSADLHSARLTLTMVKSRGARMGAVALTKPDGSGGIEATLTDRSSPDGQMYIAERKMSSKQVLDRSWFNIADDIAYHLTLEVRNEKIIVKWKNMPELSASIDANTYGKFGVFVENGTVYITDLKLEKLT